jgi:thymidylate synthase
MDNGDRLFYQTNYVRNIREEFQHLLKNEIFVTDKSGVKMLEIRGANFIADEPAIFGTPNQDYIERELAWYKSMSRNVNDIPGGPPAIWKQVADKNGCINSNYGWCIWSDENGNQYHRVLGELCEQPNSRRAVMIYTRPSMWEDYDRDGMSDFMCTNTVQYMIRWGRLHAIVQMRSNDVVFGYKNDYAWQKHVLDMLAADLFVEPGEIYWNAGSLHVYSRHFHLIG